MPVSSAPDFQVNDPIHIYALQGDWGLHVAASADGGRLVVDDPQRAHSACVAFLNRAITSGADIALIPELAIPVSAVSPILSILQQHAGSMLFLGGIEGLTRQLYESIATAFHGECQPLTEEAAGNYINALLIVIRTPTVFKVELRAKRVPSRWESHDGPPMVTGHGPFTFIQLGTPPLTILPLICSEFVWPQKLWHLVSEEIPSGLQSIDLIPVLQHSDESNAYHMIPMLHTAYTQGSPTQYTRYIFANQALSKTSDGTCYVVVPPTSQQTPAFNHARNELWRFPAATTSKGFRIPDLTGCIWSARIRLPSAGTSALGTTTCEGRVIEVLTPAAAELRGLVLGLMRSEACHYSTRLFTRPQSMVRDTVMSSLDRLAAGYVLENLLTDAANAVFYELRCGPSVGWDNVAPIIAELMEGAGLLSSGGDVVRLTASDGTNCNFAGKPILFLHSPDVDEALANRFSPSNQFNGTPIPVGVLLLSVSQGPTTFDAKRVGDVLRADRITSHSESLSDAPKKDDNSSVSARIEDVEFRTMPQLKKNLDLLTIAAARTRLQELLPKVYA
jgi:hypothetical protein